MDKADEQAERKDDWRGPKTPPRQKEENMPVIGSSCTWRDTELERFQVRVVRDVDMRQMIPEKFFEFGHLEEYEQCILLFIIDP
jgi:hypothetical protein